MYVFDTPTQPVRVLHLSVDDRKRILLAGAVVAECDDGVLYLKKYVLPNCEVFACEEIYDGQVRLGETRNLLPQMPIGVFAPA